MARPRIPAAVLADRGVPITLADNTTVTLCYTFRALMNLEERYGSLQAAMSTLEKIEEGKAFTEVTGLLSLGLLHEVEPHDPNEGQTGRSFGDPDVLVDYLDTGALEHYSEALGEAFSKAFPDTDEPAGEGDEDADPNSPGASGTTSPASASASPTTSSGA